MVKKLHIVITFILTLGCLNAAELHVSTSGHDENKGSLTKPFRTISAAAQVAQPGDTITVQEGIYRERIDPPRGGKSDEKRIVYRATPGDKVVIKGSEVIKGWEQVQNNTWKVTLPASFFGEFNPFLDHIKGDWFTDNDRVHHTGAVFLNGQSLAEAETEKEVLAPVGTKPLWWTDDAGLNPSNKGTTTIWAQFKNVNPNNERVEITTRQSVFYPSKTGINFITVRGFTMEHAATPWAPPTAEQIGLIGTNWSKGWIIEDNKIAHSTCTGITLGKYGDEFDNTAAGTAVGYNETIQRALKRGWSKGNIGSHIVRNNTIHDCGMAGICGSMGGAFSKITDNHIYNIHVDKAFTGFEMAGLKLHGAIDTLIARNRFNDCSRAIWLDWMTQGTRVTGNLVYGTFSRDDIHIEVNHGPVVIDNNLFLSSQSQEGMVDGSHGLAFAHNLFAGIIKCTVHKNRQTPYFKPHTTDILDVKEAFGGINRYYNNLFLPPANLHAYNSDEARPLKASGNIHLGTDISYTGETNSILRPHLSANLNIIEKGDKVYLEITLPEMGADEARRIITTQILGRAKLPNQEFLNYDGQMLSIDTDYSGKPFCVDKPVAGPFASVQGGTIHIKVWPRND